MDESSLYTGVDQEPGMFQNEIKEEEVERKVKDQERLLKELTPQIQEILDMLDNEIKTAESVRVFYDAASKPEENIKAEIQAIARYVALVEMLKTKFTLTLNEARKR